MICLVGIDYWCEYMHLYVPDGMAVALITHVLHSSSHLGTADATCDDAKILGHSRDSAPQLHVSLGSPSTWDLRNGH